MHFWPWAEHSLVLARYLGHTVPAPSSSAPPLSPEGKLWRSSWAAVTEYASGLQPELALQSMETALQLQVSSSCAVTSLQWITMVIFNMQYVVRNLRYLRAWLTEVKCTFSNAQYVDANTSYAIRKYFKVSIIGKMSMLIHCSLSWLLCFIKKSCPYRTFSVLTEKVLTERCHCSQNAAKGARMRCPYINIVLTLSVLTRRSCCNDKAIKVYAVKHYKKSLCE